MQLTLGVGIVLVQQKRTTLGCDRTRREESVGRGDNSLDWTVVGAVGEILGAIGVIASLVYLAGSVRSSAIASKQAAAQSVLRQLNELLYGMAFEPGGAEIWGRGNQGFSHLKTDEERIKLSTMMLVLFRLYEEAFYFWKDGAVDEWAWRSVGGPLGHVMGTPGFRDWWEVRGEWFSAEFREHLETGTPAQIRHASIMDDFQHFAEKAGERKLSDEPTVAP